jgi:hypothetical protein
MNPHTLASPAAGMTMLAEGATRDCSGGLVIHSKLQPGMPRQDLERKLYPSIVVGLFGWQRAHSQGPGLGAESQHGIRYAPADVNQHCQRLGIEHHLRELLMLKPADVELWLTTVTSTHARTLRLKEIQYKVQAVRGTTKRRLFEASIDISDSRDRPRITVQATPFARFG